MNDQSQIYVRFMQVKITFLDILTCGELNFFADEMLCYINWCQITFTLYVVSLRKMNIQLAYEYVIVYDM